MKRLERSICIFSFLFPFIAYSQNSGVKISDIPTQEDTSVVIKKGTAGYGPDFEIVSGSDEVAGDPSMGTKDSYSSWKTACETWKKETRELNKESQILTLNCNLPKMVRSDSGQNIYHSSGTYKIRVRIRNESHKEAKPKVE